MGAKRLHGPAEGNLSFYLGDLGNTIMDVDNFDDDILRHLRDEEELLRQIVSSQKYSTFVELGCASMRLLPIAQSVGLHYVGVDIRNDLDYMPRVAAPGRPRIEFFHGCLSEYPDMHIPEKDRATLCVFPFNLLGNIPDPLLALQKFAKAGLDIAILNFNCSSRSRNVRESYYRRCGGGGIRCFETAEGCVFTDCISFCSRSHHENVLVSLLCQARFEISSLWNSGTILAVHACPEGRGERQHPYIGSQAGRLR